LESYVSLNCSVHETNSACALGVIVPIHNLPKESITASALLFMSFPVVQSNVAIALLTAEPGPTTSQLQPPHPDAHQFFAISCIFDFGY